MLTTLGLAAATGPRLRRVAGWLLRVVQRSGVAHLLRRMGLRRLRLLQLEAALPPPAPAHRWAPHYPATGPNRGRVALFLGCVAREIDAASIDAALRALARLGFDVEIPAGQTCCGALHRDGGDSTGCRCPAGEIRVQAPPELERYLVEKGSVAVDGISLTVYEIERGAFSVALIPYTLQVTNVRDAQPGSLVNLEADVIAKYVERLLSARGH